jgi:hypothetical protein
MYVQVGELCLKVTHIEGRGRNRKVIRCNHYHEMMLPVRDYNSLLKMGREDFATCFENDEEDEDET